MRSLLFIATATAVTLVAPTTASAQRTATIGDGYLAGQTFMVP